MMVDLLLVHLNVSCPSRYVPTYSERSVRIQSRVAKSILQSKSYSEDTECTHCRSLKYEWSWTTSGLNDDKARPAFLRGIVPILASRISEMMPSLSRYEWKIRSGFSVSGPLFSFPLPKTAMNLFPTDFTTPLASDKGKASLSFRRLSLGLGTSEPPRVDREESKLTR